MPNSALNIFSLHGTYFREDENRLTSNLVVLLSESRATFLRAFLTRIGIDLPSARLSEVELGFQTVTKSGHRPDAEIKLGDDWHVCIEAKRGTYALQEDQLRHYVDHLHASGASIQRLVCITERNEEPAFRSICQRIGPRLLPATCWKYLRWEHVLELLKASFLMGDRSTQQLDAAVRRGRRVNSDKRFASLFIDYLGDSMSQKKVIDLLPTGEVADVAIQAQEPFMMSVALKYNIWFPNEKVTPRLARYVAYYENRSGDNPRQIAYIARVRFVWTRLSWEDTINKQEFERLNEVRAKMKERRPGWFSGNELWHVALTDIPIRLERPIRCGDPTKAGGLQNLKVTFSKLLNADTTDDLFEEKSPRVG